MNLLLENIVETFKVTHDDSFVQICDTAYRFRFVGNKCTKLLGLEKTWLSAKFYLKLSAFYRIETQVLINTLDFRLKFLNDETSAHRKQLR